MRAEYSPEELLPLSGIQHFLFCRRQWALIYIERQWQDNLFTVEGKILHHRVDDPFFSETRRGVLIARAMPVASYQLGIIGVCDVVEFYPSADGICLPGREGLYRPALVEYKRGKPKRDPIDEAQVCAQAMCLEEMLSTEIPLGYLYYGETRHRLQIDLGDDLRNLVRQIAREMHQYFQRGYTPRVKLSKACRSCSLADLCLPKIQNSNMTASGYIQRMLDLNGQ